MKTLEQVTKILTDELGEENFLLLLALGEDDDGLYVYVFEHSIFDKIANMFTEGDGVQVIYTGYPSIAAAEAAGSR